MKLYRVEVEYVYYALAKSENEAASFARDAAGDEPLMDCAYATETTGEHAKRDGWMEGSVLYQKGKDYTTMAQAKELIKAHL